MEAFFAHYFARNLYHGGVAVNARVETSAETMRRVLNKAKDRFVEFNHPEGYAQAPRPINGDLRIKKNALENHAGHLDALRFQERRGQLAVKPARKQDQGADNWF